MEISVRRGQRMVEIILTSQPDTLIIFHRRAQLCQQDQCPYRGLVLRSITRSRSLPVSLLVHLGEDVRDRSLLVRGLACRLQFFIVRGKVKQISHREITDTRILRTPATTAGSCFAVDSSRTCVPPFRNGCPHIYDEFIVFLLAFHLSFG